MPNEGRIALARTDKLFPKQQAVEWLSDIAPEQAPHDLHKVQSLEVASLYAVSTRADMLRYSERIDECAETLELGWVRDDGEWRLKLKTAYHCHCRFCPWCQWRRTLKWGARFRSALPQVMGDHPAARWIFLTLTVPNVPVDQLRGTITGMMKGWQRLHQRKEVKDTVLGWARCLEVTKGRDGKAHPHFHCLLLVRSTYFGKGYIKQARWLELWQKAMRDPSITQVDVRAVKGEEIDGAVAETFKYSVKPSDLTSEPAWLWALTDQLLNTRAVAVGGVLKSYMQDDDPKDVGDEGEGQNDGGLFAKFNRPAKRYRMRDRPGGNTAPGT